MTNAFDKDYWDRHWQDRSASGRDLPPNPYLARQLADLEPGSALDAGCGEGAEAIWLATNGWRVTAADISVEALARAADRERDGGTAGGRVQWVEADLSVWEPVAQFDLVTTHYAHPAMPQLAFYERLAAWVIPGGTLLIVGHRRQAGPPLHGHDHDSHGHDHDSHGHGHHPPEEASVTVASVTAVLDAEEWDVVTADEPTRTVVDPSGRAVELADVVVRATRRE